MESLSKEWNIQAMELALQANMQKCHTDFERSMCKAIGGKEIRERAEEMRSSGKKLSPTAIAIAQKYGFK